MSNTRKSITRKRLTNGSENIPPSILKILKNPVKNKIILELLSEHTNQSGSDIPDKNIVTKAVCESPTSLFRRRALDQRNSAQSQHKMQKTVAKTPIKQQNLRNEVLKGVVAYVEVLKNEEDNSNKYKDLVQSLGGVVKNTLSKSVTHVVFGGGSYTTYDRANLIQAHLVSTTWLIDCLKNNKRMPEKKYPPRSNDLSLTMSDFEEPQDKEIKENIENNETVRNSASTTTSYMSSPAVSNSISHSKVSDVITSMSSLRLSYSTSDRNSKSSNNSKNSFKSSKSPFSPLNKSCISNILRQLSDDDSPKEFVTLRKKKNCEKVEELNKSTEDSPKKTNIRRKLYCPDDSFVVNYSSDDERQARRLRKLKPNLNVSNKVPECVKNAIINVFTESSSSEESEIGIVNVLTDFITENMDKINSKINSSKKSRKVNNVNKGRRSSEDEQKSLAEYYLRQNNLRTSDSDCTPNKEIQKSVKKKKSLRKSQNVDTETDEDIIPSTIYSNNRNLKRKSLRQNSLAKNNSNESENTPKRMLPKPTIRRSMRISQKNFNFKELNTSDSQKSSNNSESDSEINISKQLTPNLIKSNSNKSIKPRKSLRKSVLTKPNVVKSTTSDSETENTPKRAQPKLVTSQSDKNVKTRRSIRILEKTSSDNKKTTPTKQLVRFDSKTQDLECTPNGNKRNILQTQSEKPLKTRKSLSQKIVKPSNMPKQFNPTDLRSLSEKKPINFHGLRSESDDLDSPMNTSRKRRSTLDFQSTSAYKNIKIRKINSIQHSSIVCTKMHRNEIDEFGEIVNKLGVFVVDNTVNKKTTHLVVGDWGRTLNLLKAMILGCWILKKEWLADSLKAGKWLPEEKYELTNYIPAIQTCRMQRQAFGSSYSMDIFCDCGYIYVDHSTHPPHNELKTLITWCKGKTTNLTRTAQIVVGKFVQLENVTCVNANWILDSITQNIKLPFTDYLIVQTIRRHSLDV